jgi:hypothetical protein
MSPHLQIGAALGLSADSALERFNRVVEMHPGHAHGWWYKQMAEERLGRRADRIASLERYLAVAPPEQRELIETARALIQTLSP